MARLIVSELASADQAAILNDLYAKAGLAAATKFRSLFRAMLDRLADFPASGPRRELLGPEIRIGVVSPFVLIYRYTKIGDTVTVLRIVHGRQDITRKLLATSR